MNNISVVIHAFVEQIVVEFCSRYSRYLPKQTTKKSDDKYPSLCKMYVRVIKFDFQLGSKNGRQPHIIFNEWVSLWRVYQIVVQFKIFWKFCDAEQIKGVFSSAVELFNWVGGGKTKKENVIHFLNNWRYSSSNKESLVKEIKETEIVLLM